MEWTSFDSVELSSPAPGIVARWASPSPAAAGPSSDAQPARTVRPRRAATRRPRIGSEPPRPPLERCGGRAGGADRAGQGLRRETGVGRRAEALAHLERVRLTEEPGGVEGRLDAAPHRVRH